MTTTAPFRQPKGTPGGGQFAPARRAETPAPPVILARVRAGRLSAEQLDTLGRGQTLTADPGLPGVTSVRVTRRRGDDVGRDAGAGDFDVAVDLTYSDPPEVDTSTAVRHAPGVHDEPMRTGDYRDLIEHEFEGDGFEVTHDTGTGTYSVTRRGEDADGAVESVQTASDLHDDLPHRADNYMGAVV